MAIGSQALRMVPHALVGRVHAMLSRLVQALRIQTQQMEFSKHCTLPHRQSMLLNLLLRYHRWTTPGPVRCPSSQMSSWATTFIASCTRTLLDTCASAGIATVSRLPIAIYLGLTVRAIVVVMTLTTERRVFYKDVTTKPMMKQMCARRVYPSPPIVVDPPVMDEFENTDSTVPIAVRMQYNVLRLTVAT